MVAVLQGCVPAPIQMLDPGPPRIPVRGRRGVAVAVSAMELLRPGSDLARMVEDYPHVDLLVAADDTPTTPTSLGILAGAAHDDLDLSDDLPEDDDDFDEVRDGVARLGHPGLHLHRLGLRCPVGPVAEADLVAALSELVGFDPEPGVYCLAPAATGDPGRAVVNRAAQRIARVYGIPLLRYRSLELCVVGEAGA